MTTVLPAFTEFSDTYTQGKTQLVWQRRIADLETPVSAYIKTGAYQPYTFLLESVVGNEVRGRYSIIGLAPDLIWKIENDKALLKHDPLDPESQFNKDNLSPLESLDRLIEDNRFDINSVLPPMSCGLFGYLGYEMARFMEPSLKLVNPDKLGTPDALLVRPAVLVIFDGIKNELIIVTPVRPSADISVERAYQRACSRLDEINARLDKPITDTQTSTKITAQAPPVSNTTPDDYKAMVEKAKTYIRDGDIFQVVLSQRFSQDFPLPPLDLYRALRRVDPSPFLYFLNFDSFSLVGSSPEILVRVRDNEVTVRPIAGTRRRGKTLEEDKALEAELLSDPKELAEHLMLLDLGRNDVGRVAEIGSVNVVNRFFIERYAHVMHIVSHVTGLLKRGLKPIEALIGGFPAGTVSGAPKIRAMEIIDELEEAKRGPYAGCVGYFSSDGTMDSCIVLRTALVKEGRIFIQAGAGIVADSVPELEQKECENKAAAMIRAAKEAIDLATLKSRGQ